MIEVGFNVSSLNEAGVSPTTKKTADFVWAVRFAKIPKGFIDKHWSHETFSNGATFSLDGEADKGKQNVDALQGGGLENLNVQVDDSVFVINCDNSAMPTSIDG
jgi:hypothetical protein